MMGEMWMNIDAAPTLFSIQCLFMRLKLSRFSFSRYGKICCFLFLIFRDILLTFNINYSFQASGDHLPVAPPAPPQPVPQAVQPLYNQQGSNQPQYRDPYDNSDQFDNGEYDERWNNPAFRGDGRAPAAPSRPAPAANYNYQSAAPAPAPVPRQQNYNVPQSNYNVPQSNYNQAPNHYETTPSPHRFFPPGKLNLNRTPEGFSYTFNKA